MNKLIRREKKIRKNLQKYEKKKLLLKTIFNNLKLSFFLRLKAFKLLDQKIKTKIQVKNRCILTGRGSGILSTFKISRITFKNLASFGSLNGVKKSSW